jgi:hypothetical protein
MNAEKFSPSRTNNTILKSEFRLAAIIAAFLLTTPVILMTGCARNHPVKKSESQPAFEIPEAESLHERNQSGEPLPAEPQQPEGSGVVLWAKEFEGALIEGLDGGLYEPYRPAAIQRVQKALTGRGLYTGPMNGILDLPTMRSIYSFQEATSNLQRCGIPTPYTRKMLEQGSHTDLSF